jgi:cytochrome P450
MDTVSTTLVNCMIILMKHPEEMKKLQEEIDSDFDMTLEVNFIPFLNYIIDNYVKVEIFKER